MKAFSNDPAKKEFYVNRMNAHIEADELVQGKGWENGKGCFIGCTLHEYSHARFEQAGIGPEWLAKLADKLFEHMTDTDAKEFARQFYSAIPVGAELDNVKFSFLIFVQKKNLKTLEKTLKKLKVNRDELPDVFAATKQCKQAVKTVLSAYENGHSLKKSSSAVWDAVESVSAAASAANAAESIADSAAWSAASAAAEYAADSAAAFAAEYAADSAATFAAASAAEYAAESAAWAAKSVADSAAWSAAKFVVEAAAESVSWSAESAAWSAESAAWSADLAARFVAYKKFADKLIELLKNCEGEQ